MQRQAAIQAVRNTGRSCAGTAAGHGDTGAGAGRAPRRTQGPAHKAQPPSTPMRAPLTMSWTNCAATRPQAASATSDDPAQLAGTDAAEVDADSTRSGPQVDENGERGVPFVGDRLLFLPAVKTDGTASTRMTSESAAAAAAGAPSGQSLLGDFNGDGYDDLVVGVPYEDVVTGGIRQLRRRCRHRDLRLGLRSDRRRQPGLDAGHGGHAGPSSNRAMPLAMPWPSATSTATAVTTWPSACPMRVSAGWPRPAPCRSSTARLRDLLLRAPRFGRRTAQACWKWRRTATALAQRWPQVTLTATAVLTSPSVHPTRMSPGSSTPVWSKSCTAHQPGWRRQAISNGTRALRASPTWQKQPINLAVPSPSGILMLMARTTWPSACPTKTSAPQWMAVWCMLSAAAPPA